MEKGFIIAIISSRWELVLVVGICESEKGQAIYDQLTYIMLRTVLFKEVIR